MAIETSGVDFGAYHLSANPDLYQPQLTQNFKFIFPDFVPLLKEGKTGVEDDAYIYDVSNILEVSLTSAQVPTYTQNAVTIRRGNSMAKYAGTIEWSDIELVFNCFEGAHTKDALLAWRSLCYNVKKDTIAALDNVNVPYKQNCYLVEYSGDWRKQRTWEIINAFPTNVSFTGYDFNQRDGVVTATVNLAYDRAIVNYD